MACNGNERRGLTNVGRRQNQRHITTLQSTNGCPIHQCLIKDFQPSSKDGTSFPFRLFNKELEVVESDFTVIFKRDVIPFSYSLLENRIYLVEQSSVVCFGSSFKSFPKNNSTQPLC